MNKINILLIFYCLLLSGIVRSNAMDKPPSAKGFEAAVMKEVMARLKKVQASNLSLFSRDLLKKESQLREQEKKTEK